MLNRSTHPRLAHILPLFTLSATLSSLGFAQNTVTSIPKIQGNGATSPLVDQAVTIEGVVTGDFQSKDQLNGFYVQDAHGDGDPATSDGIFVYVNGASPAAGVDVKVGDRVRVSGKVAEYKGQTQIGGTSAVQDLGPAPEPVAPIPITFPLPDGATLEPYEGMLVTFPQALTVSNQYELLKYGTLGLSLGRQMAFTNTVPLAQVKDDSAQRSVLFDDGSNATNPQPTPYLDALGSRRTGSTITGATGVLGFDFDKYRIEPTMAPVFQEANPRPATPPVVGGTLKIAAANVENYWTDFKDADTTSRGAKNAAAFARQSAKVVAELKGLDADVVGMMELENNDAAINDLLGKLNAAYGGTVYAKINDPATGVGTDRIKVGLFYKIARVTPKGASLSDPDPIYERFPVAQTFVSKANGGVFTIIVNHLKSKNVPKNEVIEDSDKGQGGWNVKRTEQAKKVAAFVQRLQQSSGDPDVLAVGDFNSYSEEDPLIALRASGLKQLTLRVPAEERYSFVFSGKSGALDHAFTTPSLEGQVTGFGEWHINSDEPTFMGYEDLPEAGFVANPYRASDHDPLLVGLNLTP